MPTILADNRKALAMTAEQADILFQRIAEVSIARIGDAAKLEKQMSTIKQKAAAIDADYVGILKPLEKDLEDYINAHLDRFQKPRMRATTFGRYGLRLVTKLHVEDDTAAIISIKAQALPALIVTEKLDLTAIKQLLTDGAAIAGCEIRSGEITKYDVKKELLDQAKG